MSEQEVNELIWAAADEMAWQQGMRQITECDGCGSLLLRDWPKAHDCPGGGR